MTPYADNYAALLRGDADMVLLQEEVLIDRAGYLLLLFKLLQTGVRLDNLQLNVFNPLFQLISFLFELRQLALVVRQIALGRFVYTLEGIIELT